MDSDKNMFGGANPHGLYVPLTEDEQEVLTRIFETDDIEIVVHGWGIVNKVKASFGDHRLGLLFRLDFTAPAAPMDVYFFDLELRIRSSQKSLMRQRYPTAVGGVPLQVCAGVFVDLAWDIAIDHLSPELVRAIKPGAFGLTSRRLDKDTKERTMQGNMKLDDNQLRMAKDLDVGADIIRRNDASAAARATKKQGYQVVETSKGVEVPDPI